MLKGGKFNITQDIWTGANQKSYIGVIAHWIDSNWIIQTKFLSLKSLKSKHDGIYLASILKRILVRFNIEDSIYA